MVDPVNYLKFKYVWITNKDDRMQKMTLLKGKFLSVQGEYYFILTSARDIS